MENDNIKELLLSISDCDEIEKALEDNNHPCHKIVQYQNTKNPGKPFQHPEPWNGHIDKAEVLFVGSNPSINFDECYPTDSWTDDDIYDFHNNRFSVANDYYQKNKTIVKYWQCMRKVTSWLLERNLNDDGIDASICATEIVHCKSKDEEGVPESCDKCTEKWMTKVLSCYKGEYIVIFGKEAEARFKRIVADNIEYFNDKKIIYAWHPSYWMRYNKEIETKQRIMNQLKK